MSQTWNGTKKETPERRTYTVDDIAQIPGHRKNFRIYPCKKKGTLKSCELVTPYAFPSGHLTSGLTPSTCDPRKEERYGM